MSDATPTKVCAFCAKPLTPKYRPDGYLEHTSKFAKRRHCNSACAGASRRGKRRGEIAAAREKARVLAERCRIHAEKMDDEGWYVTAGVLADAAEEIERYTERAS